MPHALRLRTGYGSQDLLALDGRYNPVARVGLNHLSYADPEAWKEICGIPISFSSQKGSANNRNGK